MFRVDEVARILRAEARGGAPDGVVLSVTTDSRAARPGALFVALPGNRTDGAAHAAEAAERGAIAVLCRRDAHLPALDAGIAVLRVKDPVAACGELAAHHRERLRGRVIAITGSSGKTTVKELVHWLLSWTRRGRAAPASFNNALGVPLTLLAADLDDDYVVCEVGSSGPGEIDALARIVKPDVAVVTCVGATHLEGLGTVEDVAREKSALLKWVRPGGVSVLNARDPLVTEMETPAWARVRKFAVLPPGWECGGAWITARVQEAGIDGLTLEIDGLPDVGAVRAPLLGRHNAHNVLAALAAARAAVPGCLVPESWISFRGPPMRMEIVARDGAVFLNDAYNSNPLSVKAALDTLVELPAISRIAVLGEMRELGRRSEDHHREVGRVAGSLPLDALVTIGESASTIAQGAVEGGLDPGCIHQVADVDEARQALTELVRQGPGKLVLLKASRSAGLERLLS